MYDCPGFPFRNCCHRLLDTGIMYWQFTWQTYIFHDNNYERGILDNHTLFFVPLDFQQNMKNTWLNRSYFTMVTTFKNHKLVFARFWTNTFNKTNCFMPLVICLIEFHDNNYERGILDNHTLFFVPLDFQQNMKNRFIIILLDA
jgi:hypothetical protein